MRIFQAHLIRLDPLIDVEKNVLDVVLHELGLNDETLLLGTPQIRLQGADNLILVLLIATQQILQLLASEQRRRQRRQGRRKKRNPRKNENN